MSQNSRNQGFYYYICFMIEGSGSRAGSGSGSIPLTNGSGFGRPKKRGSGTLVIEGGGSGSGYIPLTSEFGSGMPKKMLIRIWIRIRFRNTGIKNFRCSNQGTMLFMLLEIYIKDFSSGSCIWDSDFSTRIRIQRLKRHRIPDFEPQIFTHNTMFFQEAAVQGCTKTSHIRELQVQMLLFYVWSSPQHSSTAEDSSLSPSHRGQEGLHLP